MLCPGVSRGAWWGWMPRSAVSSPRKVEIPIVLGLRVEDGEGLRRARPAARPVTGLGRARHEAHQVVEERELLADQHAVLVVHTADLEQQAAQLEAGGADRLDLGLRAEGEEVVELELVDVAAERGRDLGEQRVPLGLEGLARAELALEVGQPGEHRLDVLPPDRLALGEHDPEQAPGRRELHAQVVENAHYAFTS